MMKLKSILNFFLYFKAAHLDAKDVHQACNEFILIMYNHRVISLIGLQG